MSEGGREEGRKVSEGGREGGKEGGGEGVSFSPVGVGEGEQELPLEDCGIVV